MRPTDDLYNSQVTLPNTQFYYTLDQIASMLSIHADTLKNRNILFFVGRDYGNARARIRTVNVASTDKYPEWRVSETEFTRWCRVKNIRISRRGIIPPK